MALHRFRSIWISDLHLGTRHQQNERLLDFLETTESTYLYLVGDILDLLQAQKKWHWPPVNDRIVQTVLAKAALGTTVFYLPGNHDHLLRQFNGRTVCGVQIRDSLVHETVDNRRYGSGNKLLHNVVGGRLGVFEGNGGDLRIGLPMQSLHDGQALRHTPLRLSVFIEAPREAIDAVMAQHAVVRHLVGNGWMHLFWLEPQGSRRGQCWQGQWLEVEARPAA